MHFLQVIGPIIILVHSVSILFIKRLSYAKRISLVLMIAVLVISIPYLYSFSPIVLGIVVLVTLALYGYLLLFHGNSVFDDEADDDFENIAINRPVALQEVEISGPTPVTQTPLSYSTASQFDSATPLSQTASYSANLVSEEGNQSVPYGQVATDASDMTRESESALLSDMLKKLEQIDHLLTNEPSKDTVLEGEEAEASAPSPVLAEPEVAPVTITTQEPKATASLEQMFSNIEQPSAQVEEKIAAKTLAKDLNPEDVPVLTQAEEEELLDEIEHIIAAQVETQNTPSSQTVDWSQSGAIHTNALSINTDNTVLSTKGEDVFTLKPVDEQTLEKIKEKQEEDGLLSVEEQLDKELYFQFLLYESKELLMMGMYQETVDYLKEILIDSYDKNLRRNALEILESVKVELYHPQLTGNKNQEYKYLEERKVL